MNDEQNATQPESNPIRDDNDYRDDFDIESALAAVSSIGEIAAAEQAETVAESEPDDVDDEFADEADDEVALPDDDEDFSAAMLEADETEIAPFVEADALDAEDAAYTEREQPVASGTVVASAPTAEQLFRGQFASVFPALLLIGFGVLLTLQLTTVDLNLSSDLLAPAAVIAVGVVLWVRWVGNRQRARGAFLVGSLAILSGALGLYLMQPESPPLPQAWPLFIGVLGVGLMATQVVAGRFDGRAFLMGLLLLVAGIAGFALMSDLLPAEAVRFMSDLWPFALVTLTLILLAALVRSRV